MLEFPSVNRSYSKVIQNGYCFIKTYSEIGESISKSSQGPWMQPEPNDTTRNEHISHWYWRKVSGLNFRVSNIHKIVSELLRGGVCMPCAWSMGLK